MLLNPNPRGAGRAERCSGGRPEPRAYAVRAFQRFHKASHGVLAGASGSGHALPPNARPAAAGRHGGGLAREVDHGAVCGRRPGGRTRARPPPERVLVRRLLDAHNPSLGPPRRHRGGHRRSRTDGALPAHAPPQHRRRHVDRQRAQPGTAEPRGHPHRKGEDAQRIMHHGPDCAQRR
jgi:hypothetical protein